MQGKEKFKKIEVILKDEKSKDSDFPATINLSFHHASFYINGGCFIIEEEERGGDRGKIYPVSEVIAYKTFK
jgi:hypothetical protein